MTNAWQQGRFDGLCGIYSGINAAQYLGDLSEADCAKLFEFMIKAGGDLFPAAIYDGINFGPLWEIIVKMRDHLEPTVNLEVSRPFLRRQVDCVNDFCDAIAPDLKDGTAVALVGLGKPWDHWTVIRGLTPRSILFHDSYGIKRMHRTSLAFENGERTTRLDYHQTILIKKVS